MSDHILSLKEKIGYSLGDAASHIVFDNVMLYLMFFYTDIAGLPAAFVGTMFLVTRILDAISDPCMGLIADRTRTRWGKFRPWILWSAIPFGISCYFTRPVSGWENGLCHSDLYCINVALYYREYSLLRARCCHHQ